MDVIFLLQFGNVTDSSYLLFGESPTRDTIEWENLEMVLILRFGGLLDDC